MLAARVSGLTYLCRKEVAAKMGKNKIVKLHKYNSTREKKTTIALFHFLQRQMYDISVTRCRSIYPSHSFFAGKRRYIN
jgi:hypothetical protein